MICSDTPVTLGNLFDINTTQSGYQGVASVSTLANGNAVVVWENYEGSTAPIMGQIVDPTGALIGAEFAVSGAGTSSINNPEVTVLSNGNFIVGSLSDTDSTIRVFGPTGTPLTTETTLSGGNSEAFIAPTSDGGYVATYAFQTHGVAGSYEVNAIVYDSNHVVQSNIIVDDTDGTGYQDGPWAAVAADDSFVVVWTAYEATGGHRGIFGQRYNADGTLLGVEFQIPPGLAIEDHHMADVRFLDNGEFVVAWTVESQATFETGVYFNRFDANGVAIGTQVQVNTTNDVNISEPHMTTLPDGGFVIIWKANGTLDTESGIFGQRFDINGDMVGDEFHISPADGVLVNHPDVAMINDDKLIVTWTSQGEIIGQIVELDSEVLGTSGPDIMMGTPNSDWISGLAGDDEITGKGSDDCLFGGDGNDTVLGLNGDDHLEGGAGDDSVIGASGSDLIYGGVGIDYLRGGGGIDTIYGNSGNDNIAGGGQDDRIFGGGGKDLIKGGGGDDTINGGGGKDTILGKQGDDVINGGNGADNIVAGTGNDIVTGGKGADVIFGKGGDDALFGANGADTLNGGGGNDAVAGGKGSDVIYGGAGHDILFANDNTLTATDTHADSLYGGAGNDGLNGAHGDDLLVGGLGNDELFGSLGQDMLRGGGGADTFIFWSAAETPTGAGNRDVIVDFSTGTDTIDLGVIGGTNAFTFIGTAAFSGTAMELNAISNGSETIVQADIDGDGAADFEIELTGNMTLSASDFIL